MRLRMILILSCIVLGFIWGYGGLCLSSPDGKTLANIEAIANICANGTEIVCIKYGAGFILAGILILFIRKWGFAFECMVRGILVVVAGLATPGIVNLIMTSLVDAHLQSLLWVFGAACATLAFAVAIAFFAMLWYPGYMARKRGKENINAIIALSAFSILIPFLWSIALFLAYKKDRKV